MKKLLVSLILLIVSANSYANDEYIIVEETEFKRESINLNSIKEVAPGVKTFYVKYEFFHKNKATTVNQYSEEINCSRKWSRWGLGPKFENGVWQPSTQQLNRSWSIMDFNDPSIGKIYRNMFNVVCSNL